VTIVVYELFNESERLVMAVAQRVLGLHTPAKMADEDEMRASLFGGSSTKPSGRPNRFADEGTTAAAPASEAAAAPPAHAASHKGGKTPGPKQQAAEEEEEALRSSLFKGTGGKVEAVEEEDHEEPGDGLGDAPIDDVRAIVALVLAVCIELCACSLSSIWEIWTTRRRTLSSRRSTAIWHGSDSTRT
jgi:hypothetical protein